MQNMQGGKPLQTTGTQKNHGELMDRISLYILFVYLYFKQKEQGKGYILGIIIKQHSILI